MYLRSPCESFMIYRTKILPVNHKFLYASFMNGYNKTIGCDLRTFTYRRIWATEKYAHSFRGVDDNAFRAPCGLEAQASLEH